MMIESSDFLSLVLFLIAILYLPLQKFIMRKNSHNTTPENRRFVPGKTSWPLIGETLEYFSTVQEGSLYKFVTDRISKYSSNIFKISFLGESMVVFCNAEGNKFLFSNEKKLVQVWWPITISKLFPKSDNRTSSEHSNELRNILRVIFKTDILRQNVGFMDSALKKHLETDWNCKQVKVIDKVSSYLLILSCNIFYGINDPRKIDELGKGMVDIEAGVLKFPFNFPGTTFGRAMKASKNLLNSVEAKVRERRIQLSGQSSTLEKDLMSHFLIATNYKGELFSDGDIASHLVGLLLGSYSTLYSTITSIMKYLAEFPDVYDAVLKGMTIPPLRNAEQKEIAIAKEPNEVLSWEDLRKMKYSWNVACEVLRILTPGVGSFREAITEITYDGYTIPKGSKIHWTFAATHKNPKYFNDPEKFDPSRFQGKGPAPYTFVPFGGGPRMCPGNEYARLVILVFMHNLVTQFRWEKLIPDEKLTYDPSPKPSQGFPVSLFPHNP